MDNGNRRHEKDETEDSTGSPLGLVIFVVVMWIVILTGVLVGK